ncbi:protein TOPAZ1-like [Micropterus dolomieu]|uniref:protein TOPAZ1-like n=1 Tax=Micropterus dolomieu TaxID=147949 RepID=UPI001E8E9831|nr:protein TOPAZ1-like [Micropterus dolomieu]
MPLVDPRLQWFEGSLRQRFENHCQVRILEQVTGLTLRAPRRKRTTSGSLPKGPSLRGAWNAVMAATPTSRNCAPSGTDPQPPQGGSKVKDSALRLRQQVPPQKDLPRRALQERDYVQEPHSGRPKQLSSSAPFPEYLNLAHAIVEVELCTKQEDWRRMGEVFRSICQSSQHPNQVERISGRIAIALLSESKDKLSLPFAAFADTMCQTENEDNLIRSFLGRIGVSLMLRYHKTHQWAKGRRVVEVLSIAKIEYSTLKGLFGNEDGASRCYLVTVATELFLLSGSVEGALNTLRENKWFLSSRSWPCEPADLESRTRVLIRLAEKTSHRDTLDVLCNLPGLKEPNEMVDVSKYSRLFNSHLQVCVDRQTLPVASDTVDFMLCKNLAVDHAMLQILIHKLGKQNLWLRAREVFRHSVSVGYYPGVSAPPGFMSLIVPCRLGEVELALTFEMFITVNAAAILHLSETTTSCLSITLKRTQSCESEYLSAGSRLLSAACIPQPKLIIHYNTAVNASQEQVFTLDISSARCWLRHNHLWANEVWTH